VDEIQFLPRSVTAISGDDLELLKKFLDMLNDLDDVQNIYHDAEFEGELLVTDVRLI